MASAKANGAEPTLLCKNSTKFNSIGNSHSAIVVLLSAGGNMNRIVLTAICIMTLGRFAAAAQNHQSQEAPAAPIPQQIVAAKKIFIANLGSLDAGLARYFKMSQDRAYNEFYAAMKSWGRYELVSNPADADLVFEAGFLRPTAYESFLVVPVKLVILDPKTHIPLWTFREGNDDFSVKTFTKEMATLVNDVKSLAERNSK